jgi:ribosomal protein L16 Arg81 hydroxylase
MQLKIQSNIYVTPPHSQGFSMHYDPHDIFLMQIKGPKTWQLYNSGEELPTKYRKFKHDPKLVLKLDIQSGDFLYMPRGTVHEAFASEVSTIHVNFSCKPHYGFHLIEDLAEIAEQDDMFFRKTVPHGYSSDEDKKAYMEIFSLKLAELIKKVPHLQLLKKQQENFVSQQSLDFKGYLLNSLQMETLTINSRVVKRKGFIHIVKKAGNELRISFGGQKLIVPPFIDKTLFLQDDPFVIADIKGLATADGKLALVKEFISAGFLEIVNETI